MRIASGWSLSANFTVMPRLGNHLYLAIDAGPIHDEDGNLIAVVETLRSLLHQFGRGATAAGNMVVVHCEIGSAPAIARALDRVEHALVVGTLAGDDTLLVVARDSAGAEALADELG